jgi:hypothetical protein
MGMTILPVDSSSSIELIPLEKRHGFHELLRIQNPWNPWRFFVLSRMLMT